MKILFFMLAFVSLASAGQINNEFKNEAQIVTEFSNVYNTLQPKNFRVMISSPIPPQLANGEIVIYRSTSALFSSFFWQVNGSTFSFSGERK